jgi:hypothetical protein
MLTASCHCGAIQLEVKRKPRVLCDCNCSICRRYGVLWAYYTHKTFRVVRGRSRLASYMWGDRILRFFRCKTCGCVTHYEMTRRRPASTVGVNARLMDPSIVATTRIRRFDGAKTWKYFD